MKTTGKKSVNSAMKSARIVLTVAIILVAFVLLYSQFSNKKPDKELENEKSKAIEKILSQDLITNYPATPREVVMYFTEIQKCYYNYNVNEEQLNQLATIARMLFDEELLKANPYDEYYQDLKLEIKAFKADDKKVSRIVLDKASDIKIVTMEDGTKAASLKAVYYCRNDGDITKTIETYILRKDEDGKWKIYGWGIMED